ACEGLLKAPRRNDLEENFGVGVPAERVACLLEPAAKREVVVHFAVDDKNEAPIGGDHGLVSGAAFVNDRKSAEPQRNAQIWIGILTGVVGATMVELLRHVANQVTCVDRKTPARVKSSETAHCR